MLTDSVIQVVIQSEATFMEDGANITIVAQRIVGMRDHDDVCALELLLECRSGSLLKSAVADGSDLVDEIALEVDGKTYAEGQSCAHAR